MSQQSKQHGGGSSSVRHVEFVLDLRGRCEIHRSVDLAEKCQKEG